MAKPESKAKKSEKLHLDSEIRKTLLRGIKEKGVAPAGIPRERAGKGKKPLLARDILWKLRIVSLKQINSFTRELSILLGSGMPLLLCLNNLAKRTGDEKFRGIIRRVALRIENGDPFWRALASFPRYFSKLYVNMVKTGEVSGRLDSVLNRLATFGEREYLLRRKVRGSLLYPAIVVAVAIIVSIVISVFIVPVFAEFFDEYGLELPLITRTLISISDFLPRFWYMLVLVPVFLVGTYSLLIKTVGVKLLIDRLKLKLPLIRGIILTIIASRFARSFATLLRSGVPILESLSITREIVGNEVVALHLESIRNSVERGQSLESSLQESTVLPSLLVDMIIVGEQSGTLDTVLSQIADIYDEEVNISLSNLPNIIEPFLILGMGILVALIFFSFFVPYISLIMAIGQI